LGFDVTRFAFLLAPLLLAAACSPPAQRDTREALRIEMSAEARASMERVNAARFVSAPIRTDQAASEAPQNRVRQGQAAAGEGAHAATVDESVQFDGGLVRIQVLLDRARFSPGVIDGYDGDNVRKAITAYEREYGLPETGAPSDALLTRLEGRDSAPALVSYVITEEDVRGPFVDVPSGFVAQSRLERLAYESPIEALSEKFHMDEDLMRTLNPGVDFSQAGTEIVVANVRDGLAGTVAAIEIDKSELALRAFDASGRLLAYYPVTIGSEENPPPSGEHSVTAVAFDPTYNYDPEKLPSMRGAAPYALTIAPGPNNPVGSVWIALSIPSYGIHGTPEPQLISKTSSHGCVRLTNWDAVELAGAVSEGVPVRFLEGPGQSRVASRSR
jgi:lipoprotein-anchoring transpeptidase ErfK/SrfK